MDGWIKPPILRILLKVGETRDNAQEDRDLLVLRTLSQTPATLDSLSRAVLRVFAQ